MTICSMYCLCVVTSELSPPLLLVCLVRNAGSEADSPPLRFLCNVLMFLLNLPCVCVCVCVCGCVCGDGQEDQTGSAGRAYTGRTSPQQALILELRYSQDVWTSVCER